MCLLVIATLAKTMVPWHLGPVSISSLCKLPVERMDLETCCARLPVGSGPKAGAPLPNDFGAVSHGVGWCEGWCQPLLAPGSSVVPCYCLAPIVQHTVVA